MVKKRQSFSMEGVGSVDCSPLNGRNQTGPRTGGSGALRAGAAERAPVCAPAQSVRFSPSIVSGVVAAADGLSVLGSGFAIYLLYVGWTVEKIPDLPLGAGHSNYFRAGDVLFRELLRF